MESLYSSFSGFLSRRRRPLTVLAGVAGGAYLVASYARSKLEDMQEGMGKKRANRENLRRRFQQNQEDCGFTVLALLPTLGSQILEAMDVEALTARLASMGKARAAKTAETLPAPESAASGETAAGAEQPSEDVKPPAEAPAALAPEAPMVNGTGLVNGHTTTSAVEGDGSHRSELDPHAQPFTPSAATVFAKPSNAEDTGDAAAGQTAPSPDGTAADEVAPDPSLMPSIPSSYDLSAAARPIGAPNGLEASTASLATPHASAFLPSKPINGFEALAVPPPVVLDPSLPPSESTPTASASKSKLDSMSKAEIWNELKILSFSRLLTSVYCLALLTLQTHVQLNLLGRYAYVSSVLAMAEAEDTGAEESLPWTMPGPRAEENPTRTVDLRTERRYLTFSWWLLHRGWEEVALRVREKVEEVFGSVGLKESVGEKDLKKMLGEVRRRVETESDGTPFSFAAALFPPTTVTELETLRAGGMPPHDCVVDPPLRALLDETADFIDAPDFTAVLAASVERVLSLVLEKISEGAGLGPAEEETAANGSVGSGDQPFVHPRFQELQGEEVEAKEKKVRLANLLPVISRQAHLVFNGLPNECAEALEETREILEYSSVVYTSFEAGT